MILDEFILLFKSDSKQVASDVADLTKKIEDLKNKGRDRSTQESKDLLEYQKNLKSLNEVLKQNQDRYDKIATSANNAAQAVILGFGGLAKTILGSASENSALQVQATRLGVNTRELKAYSLAVEEAGGSSQSFAADIEKFANQQAALGKSIPKVSEIVSKVRELLKFYGSNITPGQRLLIFQQTGISPENQPFLNLSDEKFNAALKRSNSLTENFEDNAKAAREFQAAATDIENDLSLIAATVTTEVTPAMKALRDILDSITKSAIEHPLLSTVGSGLTSVATVYGGLKILRGIVSAAGLGGAAGGGAAGSGVLGLGAAAGIGTIGIAGYIINKLNDSIQKEVAGRRYGDLNKESFNRIISSEPEDAAFSLQRARREYVNTLTTGKAALSLAGQSNIGTLPISSNKTVTVSVGQVNVHTNATDVTGIAGSISDQLKYHINTAISNTDDGVAY